MPKLDEHVTSPHGRESPVSPEPASCGDLALQFGNVSAKQRRFQLLNQKLLCHPPGDHQDHHRPVKLGRFIEYL